LHEKKRVIFRLKFYLGEHRNERAPGSYRKNAVGPVYEENEAKTKQSVYEKTG
jgi:hypothetical protein